MGSDLITSRTAVALAHRYDLVYAAVGMHPHGAKCFEEERDGLLALLGESKVVAVGEIGLDYLREHSSRAEQRRAFQAQLDWAKERDLPVSVHNRKADDDVLGAMMESGVRGVLHCFSGSAETARRALDAGFDLSFAGNVTFRNAVELRDVAREVPLEHMLVETDAPVLAPQPYRGKRCEPAYVAYTAQVLADARGLTNEALARAVSTNANRIFSWRA